MSNNRRASTFDNHNCKSLKGNFMSYMNHNINSDDLAFIQINGRNIRYEEKAAGWRYKTLLEKEPETIEWIDAIAPGETLWDIGANIGIYSIYAASKGIKTIAFEPHYANYYQLCQTIAINDLQDLVTPLCLALSDTKSIDLMNLASTEVGTSMSNFGHALDFRGQAFNPAFKQGMVGYDIDSFITDFKFQIPTHIKIDVDGIELSIIQGAINTLKNPILQSVSIELIDTDEQQVQSVTKILESAGFKFVHKRQNSAFATPETKDVLNFLFHKNPEKMNLSRKTKNIVNKDLIIKQIVNCINSANCDTEPCENIYMENIFPPEIYKEIIRNLPEDNVLDPIEHPDAINEKGECTRSLIDVTPKSIERMNINTQNFWMEMMQVFTSPELASSIVSKFNKTLIQRFGDKMPELVAVPIIYRDKAGYRIGIHPDAASKIATLQFYLPEDDSQRHLGTSFHKRINNDFIKLKKNVFQPNSAYAFVRTDESWHSVDELSQNEKTRNTIALTFYIKGMEYSSNEYKNFAQVNSYYDIETSNALKFLVKQLHRRDHVAKLFAKDAVGVELGVAAGDFSERILKNDNVAYLFSIDMWAGDRGHGIEQYREAITKLDPYKARNSIMRMRFDEALPLFADESLDFIYVDGYAHDGELNGQTFRDWFPKLRRGGIIAGDDYADDWPLVVSAVNSFAEENKLEIHVIECSENTWNSKYPTWLAVKP